MLKKVTGLARHLGFGLSVQPGVSDPNAVVVLKVCYFNINLGCFLGVLDFLIRKHFLVLLKQIFESFDTYQDIIYFLKSNH